MATQTNICHLLDIYQWINVTTLPCTEASGGPNACTNVSYCRYRSFVFLQCFDVVGWSKGIHPSGNPA